MRVVVVDYGMSNLGSISNALAECGGENVVITTDPKDLKSATHIVLPGVGAFTDGMANLKKFGWIEPLKQASIKDEVPLLGICLGMQLLATKGYEGGETDGLGLIDGVVDRLKTSDPKERIPHVGWNEVYPKIESALFQDIVPGTDFYFVHSYHFAPANKKNILSVTPYCKEFASSVFAGNIFGTQFHPEKSQRPGFQLLKNFLNI